MRFLTNALDISEDLIEAPFRLFLTHREPMNAILYRMNKVEISYQS